MMDRVARLLPLAASVLSLTTLHPQASAAVVESAAQVKTIAGMGAGRVTGPATSGYSRLARFSRPGGLAPAPGGGVFVADKDHHLIRLVSSNGEIRTIAGGPSVNEDEGDFEDGPALEARFDRPGGLAIDARGDLYVADTGNYRIRKIDVATGEVLTIAGGPAQGTEDGEGRDARFWAPTDVAVGPSGTLYVADGACVRRITPDGMVTTVAGNQQEQQLVDELGHKARFKYLSGIAVDRSENVYVADTENNRIRKISPDGRVSTFLGGVNGGEDGRGTSAQLSLPTDVFFGPDGRFYLTEQYYAAGDESCGYGNRIRVATPDGDLVTVAGEAAVEAHRDGQANQAAFDGPGGIAVDNSGMIFVADSDNDCIRTVRLGDDVIQHRVAALPRPQAVQAPLRGVVTTIAGSRRAGYKDGPIASAEFNFPKDVAVDSQGVVYVADGLSYRLRRVAGQAVSTYVGHWNEGETETYKDGPTTQARLSLTFYITRGMRDEIVISDTGNHRVRKVVSPGIVQTLAGDNGGELRDGRGEGASFYYPHGVAMDGLGNFYIADNTNHAIRKILTNGQVTTLAGGKRDEGGRPLEGYEDGPGSQAAFSYPTGVTLGRDGSVYVADSGNSAVRKITPSGQVSTLAGGWGAGYADGVGRAARFSNPSALEVDAKGYVYVSDTHNHRIRVIDPQGRVSTLAGNGTEGFGDGTGLGATFNYPAGLFLAPEGLYVADSGNHCIRLIR